jgi:CDP-paratose 2-epimerase
MKLLITGGCGFLGSNLAAEAIKKNVDLIVFDNLSRFGSNQNLEWLKSQGEFKFIPGDIRNFNDVERVIQEFKPDQIFHLAGQVAMTTSISNPRLDFETNSLGTLNVLESVRKHAPQCGIIYSSTNKVYGDLDQFSYGETDTRLVCIDKPNGFDENTLLNFHSPYGCSKGSADQYMLDYARIFGLKTVVFRHSSMYGGRQFATSDQGWVGWFCQKAVETQKGVLGTPFTISGTGKQVRDVLHAEDMIALYFSTAQVMESVRGEVFNIGGGRENSLSLLELFKLLEELLQIKLDYTNIKARESDQRVFIADISKAKTMINWFPQVTARKGVSQMIDWIHKII